MIEFPIPAEQSRSDQGLHLLHPHPGPNLSNPRCDTCQSWELTVAVISNLPPFMGCCVSSGQVESCVTPVIAVLGIDGAGKSTLAHALAGDSDYRAIPTVGLEQREIEYEGTTIKLYDLGGGPDFRKVWGRFYAELWGFVFVVDSCDKYRMDEASEVLAEIANHKMMAGKPFVIVANKQDLAGAMGAGSVRDKLGRGLQAPVFAGIANRSKLHLGIRNAMTALISEIKDNAETIAIKVSADMEEQGEIETKEREERMARIREAPEQEYESSEESAYDYISSRRHVE